LPISKAPLSHSVPSAYHFCFLYPAATFLEVDLIAPCSLDNGSLIVNQSSVDAASAQAYFLNQLIDIQLSGGLNNIQLSLSEAMSGGEGFSIGFASASVSAATPLPASWTMMVLALAALIFVFRSAKVPSADVIESERRTASILRCIG
jgi:hypothetical protein